MSRVATLPAKKEINLFTSSKNVDKSIVDEITNGIRQAKRISITGAKGFNIGLYKKFTDLNIDTVMYLFHQYGFEKPEVQTTWDNKLYIQSETRPKKNIIIQVISEEWDVNLLPNDVKEFI